MISINTLYALVGIAAIGLVPLMRYTYRRIRKTAKREVLEAMTDDFVVEMATNHLPHIYHALEIICKALDVELGEPPAINFIPLDTNGTYQTSNSGRNRTNQEQ